jgi:hypothetical protein
MIVTDFDEPKGEKTWHHCCSLTLLSNFLPKHTQMQYSLEGMTHAIQNIDVEPFFLSNQRDGRNLDQWLHRTIFEEDLVGIWEPQDICQVTYVTYGCDREKSRYVGGKLGRISNNGELSFAHSGTWS